jgi:hypothetical protein
MRTTLTLSPASTAFVKEEMRRSGQGFKEAVNELIRLGHYSRNTRAASDKPFKVRAKALGERPGFNFDNIGELLDQLDELETSEDK